MIVQKCRTKPVPRPVPEETDVIIFGQKFPKDTVKNWNDIKKEKTLGSGQFGIVYKGFLHLNKYTRYCGMISTIYFHPVTRLVN